MKFSGQSRWAGVLLALTLAGCASSPPERTLSQNPASFAMLQNGMDPMHPDQRSTVFAKLSPNPDENAVRD